MDLAGGHVSALQLLDSPKCFAVNFGSSVLDIVTAFEKASGRYIPYDVKPHGAPVISTHITRRPTMRPSYWAGRQRGHSRRCAPIIGDGRAATQMDMLDEIAWSDAESFKRTGKMNAAAYPGLRRSPRSSSLRSAANPMSNVRDSQNRPFGKLLPPIQLVRTDSNQLNWRRYHPSAAVATYLLKYSCWALPVPFALP